MGTTVQGMYRCQETMNQRSRAFTAGRMKACAAKLFGMLMDRLDSTESYYNNVLVVYEKSMARTKKKAD